MVKAVGWERMRNELKSEGTVKIGKIGRTILIVKLLGGQARVRKLYHAVLPNRSIYASSHRVEKEIRIHCRGLEVESAKEPQSPRATESRMASEERQSSQKPKDQRKCKRGTLISSFA